jgi:hypothetical protein
LIRINGELYEVKSKFHIHGCFLFRKSLLVDLEVFPFSILDDRLIIDGLLLKLLLVAVEEASCFVWDDEESPPVRRLINDYRQDVFYRTYEYQ